MTCRKEIEKKDIPTDRQLTLNLERQTARVIIKASGFGDEFKDLNPTLSAVEVYSKLKVPAEDGDSYEAIQACKKKKWQQCILCFGIPWSCQFYREIPQTHCDIQ